jgi:hypothetical protein
MTYNKAEVLTLANALHLIQGTNKGPYPYPDFRSGCPESIGAYESDE